MTVWCLTPSEKIAVAELYKQRFHTQQDLAEHFNVSVSTICVTLQEMKVTHARPKPSIEQVSILHWIQQNKISLNQLKTIFA